MSDVPLNSEQIRALLLEVGDELGSEGPEVDVLVIGGALLSFLGLRLTTIDVDSAIAIHIDVKVAAHRVAERHGLMSRWLNDGAAVYAPENLDAQEAEVLFRRGRLVVRVADPDLVFLMKMHAGREQDREDMQKLWPLTSFGTPREAARAFVEAYPENEGDPFLVEYLESLMS